MTSQPAIAMECLNLEVGALDTFISNRISGRTCLSRKDFSMNLVCELWKQDALIVTTSNFNICTDRIGAERARRPALLRASNLLCSSVIYFFVTLAAVLGITSYASAQSMPFNHPPIGPPWPPRNTPSWLDQGMLMAETNEPLRWNYRKNTQSGSRTARSGGAAKAFYDEEHSEATIIALKEMGVNVFLTSFHKGFGIANERAHMEEARGLAKILHKHGMKMAVYVSALLLYEEL